MWRHVLNTKQPGTATRTLIHTKHHIFDKRHRLHVSLTVSAFIKPWKYTGYIDLEPEEWKKKPSWLSVSSVLKLMWHLLNKSRILLVSFRLPMSDEASARLRSPRRAALREPDPSILSPFADTHLFITSWGEKRDVLAKKNTHGPRQSGYVERRRGEALLQRVTFECLGGGMRWCVCPLLCVSAARPRMKSHSGMGHFVIKRSVVTQVVTLLSSSFYCQNASVCIHYSSRIGASF